MASRVRVAVAALAAWLGSGCSVFDVPAPGVRAARAATVPAPKVPADNEPAPERPVAVPLGRAASPEPASPGVARGAVAALGEMARAVLAGGAKAEGGDQEPVLVATAKETPIRARPSAASARIGYLRSGAVVSRRPDAIRGDGCPGGFHEIAPEGYVCVGPAASIDPAHELARVGVRRADRTAPLPYVYGRAPVAGAPLYTRIPTAPEQQATEPGLERHRARSQAQSWGGVPLDDVPWFLQDSAPSIGTNGARRSVLAVASGAAIARSGFAFTSLFESGGRRFGLTADMSITPLDRFEHVEPSRFHGMPLGEGLDLPVVFAWQRSAALYSGDPRTGGLVFERRLERREALAVTGKRVRTGDAAYLETKDGKWLADTGLLKVSAPPSLAPWAADGRRWVDVSLREQVLVAYEGSKPVFVTLVSTGLDEQGGDMDSAAGGRPSRLTPEGLFRIHTKHVTATMDSDAVDDQFDLRDVPYVQYFQDGYAFHAAYWHDAFGAPRSHGCVNLSPLDARWLFSFTDPPVPTAWHGAMSTRGTFVRVRG